MAFCSPKLDQVSANKIIEESIKREERTIRLATEFTVHSTKKMSCIPDKPNYTTPACQPTEDQLQAAHDKLATLANVKHAEHLPAQIYSLPATSNMDYGFWHGPTNVKNPMFQHSKGHCDVTRYAADYVALKGEHLFSSKSGTGSGTGGKAKG